MLAVGAMVTFVVVILIVWTSAWRIMWTMVEYEDQVSALKSSAIDSSCIECYLPSSPTQADRTKKFVVYYASTSGSGPFLLVLQIVYAILLLFGMFMAYQIKRNIKSFYKKYNDSPIVNLASLLALTISFGSHAGFILLVPAKDTVGVSLLLLLLRDGSWMFPMLGFIYLPMVSGYVRLCVCVRTYDSVYIQSRMERWREMMNMYE